MLCSIVLGFDHSNLYKEFMQIISVSFPPQKVSNSHVQKICEGVMIEYQLKPVRKSYLEKSCGQSPV